MEHADGHRYFEGLAVAHVLGGLDDSEGRVFRAHLLECSNCRARVGELRAIAHDLADVERDERRVRAAQAIDTKRRESEEEVAEPAEQMPSPRSSRITVIVGLVLIMGLSLWNFTLRSALTLQEGQNRLLERAGEVADLGEKWVTVTEARPIVGSVKVKDDQVLLTLTELDDNQKYGVYAQNGDKTVANFSFSPDEGRLYHLFKLPDGVDKITVTDPMESEGEDPADPDSTPDGETVFQALKPSG